MRLVGVAETVVANRSEGFIEGSTHHITFRDARYDPMVGLSILGTPRDIPLNSVVV